MHGPACLQLRIASHLGAHHPVPATALLRAMRAPWAARAYTLAAQIQSRKRAAPARLLQLAVQMPQATPAQVGHQSAVWGSLTQPSRDQPQQYGSGILCARVPLQDHTPLPDLRQSKKSPLVLPSPCRWYANRAQESKKGQEEGQRRESREGKREAGQKSQEGEEGQKGEGGES